MKLSKVIMKALLLVGMTLTMVNCSGAHEDDASLEAQQQQAEDGQVIVYDEQGEQQQQEDEVSQQQSQQQDEVSQQESQQQDEVAYQQQSENADYANDEGEELVSDDNNQQEENLNNMLNRISDDQEPMADDQTEMNSEETADSADDQNSYDDQAQNDVQEETAVSNNDAVQTTHDNYQDYASSTKNMNNNSNYQTSGKVHIVKEGESLSKISKMYYGKYKFWRGLASANDIRNPNIIYPGQRIQMVVADQSAAVDSSGQSSYQGGDYVVRAGETLGDVSRQVYGSSKYWKALFLKNSEKISNPDMIYQGQTLSVVPQADLARFQEEATNAVAH